MENSIVDKQTNTKLSYQELSEWITTWLSRNVKVSTIDISLSMSFSDLGMDSVQCLELAHEIEKKICVAIDPTIAWQAPTIHELIKLVYEMQHEADEVNEVDVIGEKKKEISDDELMSLIFD